MSKIGTLNGIYYCTPIKHFDLFTNNTYESMCKLLFFCLCRLIPFYAHVKSQALVAESACTSSDSDILEGVTHLKYKSVSQ